MTVFKAFLKVLSKNKAVIILYTSLLIVFGGLNFATNDTTSDYIASKPDIAIINRDEKSMFTKSLVEYFSDNSNIKDVDNLEDALFYRDISYIITIEEGYGESFINGENPEIKVKSTGDYEASLAGMYLEKYIKVANVYRESGMDENEIIEKTKETLKELSDVKLTSKLDTSTLSKTAVYFNYMNYALLAGCIMAVSSVLNSFHDDKIKKRTTISGLDHKKYNHILLLGNGIFAFILWLFYIIMGYILIGNTVVSKYGLIYILNSFIFMLCTLSIAFLISNLINNKNAIGGIVNVVALGSSFLCGTFVPMEWLPSGVLKVAHVLPSYWYIKSNEILKTMEVFNLENLKPIFINMSVVLGFTIVFIIISNIVSKKKRRVA